MRALATIAAAIAALAAGAVSMQERVSKAAEDPSKIAALMPADEESQAKFKAQLVEAAASFPGSPEERCARREAVSNELAKLQAEKLWLFPSAAPASAVGASALDLRHSSTNLLDALVDEIDMGYGLDRKPRTMDKSKKQCPSWQRGWEPGCYDGQTAN